MLRLARLACVIGAFATLAIVAPAVSRAASGKKEFKNLLNEATAAFKVQDYQRALERYKQAYEIAGDPRLLFMIGRTQEELGQLDDALQSFRLCVAGNPPAEVAGRAKEKIKALEDLLATGRVFLLIVPAGAEATIDGVSIGVAPFPPKELKPGAHMLFVSKPGFRPHTEKVEVPGGGEITVKVTLESEGGEPGPGPGPGPDDPGVVGGPDATPKPGVRPWNWVLIGTGGGMTAAGIGVLVKGFLDHGDLDGQSRENPSMTLKEARDLQDAGNLEKTIGAVLLGAGGAALAAGIVLTFVPSRGPAATEEQPAEEDEGDQAWFDLSPARGGAVLSVGGRF